MIASSPFPFFKPGVETILTELENPGSNHDQVIAGAISLLPQDLVRRLSKRLSMSSARNVSLSEKMLERAVVNIARSVGDDINLEKPLLEASLPDGSRAVVDL